MLGAGGNSELELGGGVEQFPNIDRIADTLFVCGWANEAARVEGWSSFRISIV